MSTSIDQDTPQVPLENATSRESSSETTQEVGLKEVERASKAAKVAQQLAEIKKMKSAYSSSTTIDLATLTQSTDLPDNEPLVDTSLEEE